MKYIVSCRKKGALTETQFRGFGPGFPNRGIADKVFRREVATKSWDAVYLERLGKKGEIICIKDWAKP